MKRKIQLTVNYIIGIAIALLMIGACIYYFHLSTPVDLNLNATKLDSNGNPSYTTPILITGSLRDYVFQDDRLDVRIAPFDEVLWVRLTEEAPSKRSGIIYDYFSGCKKVYFHGASHSTDLSFCTMLFTENFEYIALICGESDPQPKIYVASADNTHTAEEVLQFFRNLAPGYTPF